ncbi:MAG: hypothetical protein VB085_11315 [Peptococcaceae bacterium]|nr:hypothetical protein [Peptococcaceae bacterium]
MDILMLILVWAAAGIFSGAKKKAQQEEQRRRQSQRAGNDPEPYGNSGRNPASRPQQQRPGREKARGRQKPGTEEEWIPSQKERPVKEKKSAADRQAVKGKAGKKTAPAETQFSQPGSLTDYVSPEGPRHEERVTHIYGTDECAPQMRANRSGSADEDIGRQLVQGMIWSQILGQPRCRQPYFRKGIH